MHNDHISHYGVKGMKWGVRKSRSKSVRSERRAAVKNRRNLSNDELTKRIQRLENEKRLKTLTEEDLYPGKRFATSILKNVGSQVLTTVATGAAFYAIKAAVTKKFDASEFAAAITKAPTPKKKKKK